MNITSMKNSITKTNFCFLAAIMFSVGCTTHVTQQKHDWRVVKTEEVDIRKLHGWWQTTNYASGVNFDKKTKVHL